MKPPPAILQISQVATSGYTSTITADNSDSSDPSQQGGKRITRLNLKKNIIFAYADRTKERSSI